MIAAKWVPEGNGPDGVFACVPLTTSLPPPTGSPFQQDVMYYANTVLGFASGNIANIDQISMILSAGIGALIDTTSHVPGGDERPAAGQPRNLPAEPDDHVRLRRRLDGH